MKKSKFRAPPSQLFQWLYAIGLGPLVGRFVLLLTTTGRKTGRLRTTPLQYEQVGEDIYLGSSRGVKSDWYCNICANPKVVIRVKNRQFPGLAETVTDPNRIADFLELRLKRHPAMMARILAMEGLPAVPSREQLVEYSVSLALVIVHPSS